MRYQTLTQAADERDVSRTYMHKLLRTHRIKGALWDDLLKRWRVPAPCPAPLPLRVPNPAIPHSETPKK